jgi:hypothetical protein
MPYVYSESRLTRLVIAVVVLLALAGCGVPLRAAKPTPTPPTAQQILGAASKAQLRDATVTLALDFASTSGVTQHMSFTGTATASPLRSDLTMTSSSTGGQTYVTESISDAATQTTYTKVVEPAILANGLWTRSSTSDYTNLIVRLTGASIPDLTTVILRVPYDKQTDPTLVGREKLNGTSVWHVRSTTTANGITSQQDFYMREDTYLPVKLESKSAIASGTGRIMIKFSLMYEAVNTGVAIALPPDDMIERS